MSSPRAWRSTPLAEALRAKILVFSTCVEVNRRGRIVSPGSSGLSLGGLRAR